MQDGHVCEGNAASCRHCGYRVVWYGREQPKCPNCEGDPMTPPDTTSPAPGPDDGCEVTSRGGLLDADVAAAVGRVRTGLTRDTAGHVTVAIRATDRDLLVAHVDRLAADVARLTAERDKLAAFKAWDHGFLDTRGVPPPPPTPTRRARRARPGAGSGTGWIG